MIGNRRLPIAFKRRLRQPVLAPGHTCIHRHTSGTKKGGPCDNPDDTFGDYTVKRMVGPHRVRWHNDIKLHIAETLRSVGAFVKVELYVPHLYNKWKKDGEL